MSRIDEIWPDAELDLDDDALLRRLEPPQRPWLRMNFITSLDGAATRDGRSGGLGDDADRRVFDLLRHWADVVLLGAGTARIEGYGAMRVGTAAAAWRAARGMPPHPVLALVTRRLDLDPSSPIFVDAPQRPIVFTVASAPARRREELAEVATVLDAGVDEVGPQRVRRILAEQGLTRIHSEGGPRLFGSFLDGGAVDELCLTLAATLESGESGRIAHGPRAVAQQMRLASVLRAGDELLLRYTTTCAQTTRTESS